MTAIDRRLVAVMFTDMVGYTAMMQTDERLARDKRARYTSALDTHHDVGGGTIVQRLGDGSLSMFPNAIDAVQSAIGIQRELTAQGVPVRIGIHLGEVIVEPTGLVGDAVNIASRIESFAVPGSVMVSDSVYDQLRNRSEMSFTYLGRFRLKNVGRQFEIHAASADGIVVPDPGTLMGKGERFATLPGRLPVSATELQGRDEDLAALSRLVEEHQLVTITGPGGVGKTRTMIELGRRLAPAFLDGVVFVPFAEIEDPDDFVPALAEALDVKEAEERTLRDGIVDLIADKKALLLLDNLEQVVSAGPEIGRLTAESPELRIVTTSRTPLRIAAEHEYELAPLLLPPTSIPPAPEPLLSYPSVGLFVDRARSASRSFDLTSENAHTVVAVCRRLDGLPLALELAAARLRTVPLDALVDRLDNALDVLTSGPRDVPGRHQTLRSTIDWSHSLLTASGQRLFRRMAVFSGGCTFADLEAVCSDPDGSFLDDLASLVDNALVRSDPSQRLGMLQTIAEFARERLAASDEAAEIAGRHALRYAELACAIRDGIEGAEQVDSIERGIAEESNLHVTLDTLLARARAGDLAAAESGMQLCGDLWLYWHIRGKNVTAREYATSFLDAAGEDLQTVGRAGALITAGLASWILGRIERANREWGEAHRIAVAAESLREMCIAAFFLGLGHLGIDVRTGLRWTAEAIERSRAAGFAWAEGFASSFEGLLHVTDGDLGRAEESLSRAASIQRRLDDKEGLGLSLGGLAQVMSARGDLATAVELYMQSLAAFEAIGDRAEEARILSELAWTLVRNEDPAARGYFIDSVRAYIDVASARGVGLSMVGLAACEAVQQRPFNAVAIAAAAEGFAAQEGIVNVYSDETPGREFVDGARAELSTADVARASAIGGGLTVEQALELAQASESGAVE